MQRVHHRSLKSSGTSSVSPFVLNCSYSFCLQPCCCCFLVNIEELPFEFHRNIKVSLNFKMTLRQTFFQSRKGLGILSSYKQDMNRMFWMSTSNAPRPSFGNSVFCCQLMIDFCSFLGALRCSSRRQRNFVTEAFVFSFRGGPGRSRWAPELILTIESQATLCSTVRISAGTRKNLSWNAQEPRHGLAGHTFLLLVVASGILRSTVAL